MLNQDLKFTFFCSSTLTNFKARGYEKILFCRPLTQKEKDCHGTRSVGEVKRAQARKRRFNQGTPAPGRVNTERIDHRWIQMSLRDAKHRWGVTTSQLKGVWQSHFFRRM